MSSEDKRAALSSRLLGEKRKDPPSEGAPSDLRRDDAKEGPDQAPAGRTGPRAAILFDKGAASAEGFKPGYWSYRSSQPHPASPGLDAVPARQFAAASVAQTDAAGRAPAKLRLVLAGLVALCSVLIVAMVFTVLWSARRSEDAPVARSEEKPVVQSSAPSRAERDTPAKPSVVAPLERAPAQAVARPAEPSPPPSTSREARRAVPPENPAELVDRGDQVLRTGDIASARSFYERAAEAGSGRAALMVGATFDPAFLKQAGVHGLRGDAAKAYEWYRRAQELGDPDAEQMMKGLLPK